MNKKKMSEAINALESVLIEEAGGPVAFLVAYTPVEGGSPVVLSNMVDGGGDLLLFCAANLHQAKHSAVMAKPKEKLN